MRIMIIQQNVFIVHSILQFNTHRMLKHLLMYSHDENMQHVHTCAPDISNVRPVECVALACVTHADLERLSDSSECIFVALAFGLWK